MTDRIVKFHYHRRDRIYRSHLFRIFRPMGGGIGIVVWRWELSMVNQQAELARLRRIKDAAREIVDGHMASTYHDAGSIIARLRAALEADHD
jgi:hypothetical protein